MRPVLTLALVALVGCDPPLDPEAGCGTGPGALEVGRVVNNRLESIEPRGPVTIVPGAQGGIHLLVGVWASDLDLEMTLTYRLSDPDTDAMLGLETELALRPSFFDRTGPRPERSPDLLVLDNNAMSFEQFDGRSARLEARAVTDGGAVACDERLVTLVR